jgi:hypothetical protein
MPAKIIHSFGHPLLGPTWNQIVWNPVRMSQITHNTPEGDRQRSIPTRHDGTTEDLLLLIAARQAWPRLRLGQTYTAPVLSSLLDSPNVYWSNVEFTLAKDRETVAVPAGSFRVYAFRAKWPDNRVLRIDVEADAPNRIVRWQDNSGTKAQLIPAPPA